MIFFKSYHRIRHGQCGIIVDFSIENRRFDICRIRQKSSNKDTTALSNGFLSVTMEFATVDLVLWWICTSEIDVLVFVEFDKNHRIGY